MNDWQSGYVADVAYQAAYFHDQSPHHLSFICLLNGFEPPAADRAFVYCELGCGSGLTLNLLAAANPHGRFIGVDFNPTHISEARSLAAAAGLANVEYHEDSFSEFLDNRAASLPPFDMVTAHGVYTWIDTAERRAIVEILRRKVRSGGLVYISYNALPGWEGGGSLQWLLREYGDLGAERTDRRFEHAFAFVEALAAAEFPTFKDNRFLEAVRDLRDQGKTLYLAHEYMDRHWRPAFHAEIARELSAAKLSFVGSSRALDNFSDLNFTPERRRLLDQVGCAELRETLKDFCHPRLLRKDVFMRGPRRLMAARQEQLLMRQRIALVIPRASAQLTMTVPIGEIQADEAVFAPVLDALVNGPKAMADLLAVSAAREKTGAKAAEIAGLLIGTGQAAAAVPTDMASARDGTAALNDALAGRAALHGMGEKPFALAAPELGGALTTVGFEMRVYAGLAAGVAPEVETMTAYLWRSLADQGERLMHEGAVVDDEDCARALLRDNVRSFLDKQLPVWRDLAVIDEA